MIVHVTNGVYFNTWLMKKTGIQSIPFNEAMMTGSVMECPFDEAFICHRAMVHRVLKEDYMNNMKPFLDVINQLNQVDELILWFGIDAFCQMNLLTIYQVLKQHNYQGVVKTVLFDENEPWDKILHQRPLETKWETMSDLYQKVLVERKPVECDDEIMNRAIRLYLDLHDSNGRLNQLIRQYPSMSENELVEMLMEHSKKEGLSDVQALEMIRKVREVK